MSIKIFFVVFSECINVIHDIDRFPNAEPFLHPGEKVYLAMVQSFVCLLAVFSFVFNALSDLVNILLTNCYLYFQLTFPLYGLSLLLSQCRYGIKIIVAI